MEEARRFLRFSLPGLIFIIELAILPLIFTGDLNIYFDEINNIGAGAPVILFLVAAGVGYLLANIYHFFHNNKFLKIFPVNHKKLLMDLEKKKLLVFYELTDTGEDKEVDLNDLKKMDAWNITTSLWHGMKGTSKDIREATPRVKSLADLAYGLGASLIGSVIVLFIALPYFFISEECTYNISTMIFSLKCTYNNSTMIFYIYPIIHTLLFIVPFCCNLRRVNRSCERIVYTLLFSAVRNKQRKEERKEPFPIFVDIS